MPSSSARALLDKVSDSDTVPALAMLRLADPTALDRLAIVADADADSTPGAFVVTDSDIFPVDATRLRCPAVTARTENAGVTCGGSSSPAADDEPDCDAGGVVE